MRNMEPRVFSGKKMLAIVLAVMMMLSNSVMALADTAAAMSEDTERRTHDLVIGIDEIIEAIEKHGDEEEDTDPQTLDIEAAAPAVEIVTDSGDATVAAVAEAGENQLEVNVTVTPESEENEESASFKEVVLVDLPATEEVKAESFELQPEVKALFDNDEIKSPYDSTIFMQDIARALEGKLLVKFFGELSADCQAIVVYDLENEELSVIGINLTAEEQFFRLIVTDENGDPMQLSGAVAKIKSAQEKQLTKEEVEALQNQADHQVELVGVTVEAQVSAVRDEEAIVDPELPEVPVDPENPIDPEVPIDPEEPVDPENPIDPEDPTDPEDPGEDPSFPDEPGDETGADETDPAADVESSDEPSEDADDSSDEEKLKKKKADESEDSYTDSDVLGAFVEAGETEGSEEAEENPGEETDPIVVDPDGEATGDPAEDVPDVDLPGETDQGQGAIIGAEVEASGSLNTVLDITEEDEQELPEGTYVTFGVTSFGIGVMSLPLAPPVQAGGDVVTSFVQSKTEDHVRIYYVDPYGYALAGKFEVYKTTANGTSWSKVSDGTTSTAKATLGYVELPYSPTGSQSDIRIDFIPDAGGRETVAYFRANTSKATKLEDAAHPWADNTIKIADGNRYPAIKVVRDGAQHYGKLYIKSIDTRGVPIYNMPIYIKAVNQHHAVALLSAYTDKDGMAVLDLTDESLIKPGTVYYVMQGATSPYRTFETAIFSLKVEAAPSNKITLSNVYAPSYILDDTKEGMTLRSITLTTPMDDYGKVTLNIVDDAGMPIEGMPIYVKANSATRNSVAIASEYSDKDGKVVIDLINDSRLALNTEYSIFQGSKEGYQSHTATYLMNNVKFVAGADNKLTATLNANSQVKTNGTTVTLDDPSNVAGKSFTIVNKKVGDFGKIIVTALDNASKPMEKVKFFVKTENQYTTEGHNDTTIVDGRNVYETVTDANGQAVIYTQGGQFELGRTYYVFQEPVAGYNMPKAVMFNFTLNSSNQKISISGVNTTDGVTVTDGLGTGYGDTRKIEIKNKLRANDDGMLLITKTSQDNPAKPIAGAKFIIKRQLQSGFSPMEFEVETGADGIARFDAWANLDYAYKQTYYDPHYNNNAITDYAPWYDVYEETVDGYATTTRRLFTVSVDKSNKNIKVDKVISASDSSTKVTVPSSNGSSARVTVTNPSIAAGAGVVTIRKVDSVTGQGIPNAKFHLKQENTSAAYWNRYTWLTVTTDADGYANVDMMKLPNWYLNDTKTLATYYVYEETVSGYQNVQNYLWSFQMNDITKKVTVENNSGSRSTITGSGTLSPSIVLKTTPVDARFGKVYIEKVDQFGKPIPNAPLKLINGTHLITAVTDAEGKAVFDVQKDTRFGTDFKLYELTTPGYKTTTQTLLTVQFATNGTKFQTATIGSSLSPTTVTAVNSDTSATSKSYKVVNEKVGTALGKITIKNITKPAERQKYKYVVLDASGAQVADFELRANEQYIIDLAKLGLSGSDYYTVEQYQQPEEAILRRVLIDGAVQQLGSRSYTIPGSSTSGETVVQFVNAYEGELHQTGGGSTVSKTATRSANAETNGYTYEMELVVSGNTATSTPGLGGTGVSLLVITDTSGSMIYENSSSGMGGQARWNIARESIADMMESIIGPGSNPNNQVSIAHFNSSGYLKMDWTNAGDLTPSDFAMKKQAILNWVVPDGNTNWVAGFKQAQNQLKKSSLHRNNQIYIVYITDGNTSQTTAEAAIAVAKEINRDYPDAMFLTMGIGYSGGINENVLRPVGEDRYWDDTVTESTAQGLTEAFRGFSNVMTYRYENPNVLDEISDNVEFVPGSQKYWYRDSSSDPWKPVTGDTLEVSNGNKTLHWYPATKTPNDPILSNWVQYRLTYDVKVTNTNTNYNNKADADTGTHAGDYGWFTNRSAELRTNNAYVKSFPMPVAQTRLAQTTTQLTIYTKDLKTNNPLSGVVYKVYEKGSNTALFTLDPTDVADGKVILPLNKFTGLSENQNKTYVLRQTNFTSPMYSEPSLNTDLFEFTVLRLSDRFVIMNDAGGNEMLTSKYPALVTIASGGVVTVYNKEPDVQLNLTVKLTDGTNPLSGGAFTLTSTTGLTYTATQSPNGTFKFSPKLFPGTYTLTQTATAADYNMMTPAAVFTVSGTGAVTLTNNGGGAASHHDDGSGNLTVTVKNTRKSGNVTIQRIGGNSGASYDYVITSGGSTVQTVPLTAGQTSSVLSLPVGTYVITQQDPGYQYYVSGITGATSNNLTNRTATITVSAGGSVKVVYTNAQKTGSIKFVKYDEKNQALAGAEFGLYRDQGCTSLVTKATSTTSGVTFTNVPFGQYWIKEISAPADYAVHTGVYEVTAADWSGKANGATITPKLLINGIANTRSNPYMNEMTLKVQAPNLSSAGIPMEGFAFVLAGTPSSPTSAINKNVSFAASDITGTPTASGQKAITHTSNYPAGTYTIKINEAAVSNYAFDHFEVKIDGTTVVPNGANGASFTVTAATTSVEIIAHMKAGNAEIGTDKLVANKTIKRNGVPDEVFTLNIKAPDGRTITGTRAVGSTTFTLNTTGFVSNSRLVLPIGQYTVEEPEAPGSSFECKGYTVVVKDTTYSGGSKTFTNGTFVVTSKTTEITITVKNEVKEGSISASKFTGEKNIVLNGLPDESFDLRVQSVNDSSINFTGTRTAPNTNFVFNFGSYVNGGTLKLPYGDYKVTEILDGNTNFQLAKTNPYTIYVTNGGTTTTVNGDTFTIGATTTAVRIVVKNEPYSDVIIGKSNFTAEKKVPAGSTAPLETFTINVTNNVDPTVKATGTVNGTGAFTMNWGSLGSGSNVKLPAGLYTVTENAANNFNLGDVKITVTDARQGGTKVFTNEPFLITPRTTKVVIEVVNNPKTKDRAEMTAKLKIDPAYDAGLAAESFKLNVTGPSGFTAPNFVTASDKTSTRDFKHAGKVKWTGTMPYGNYTIKLANATSFEVKSISVTNGSGSTQLGTYNAANGTYSFTVDSTFGGIVAIDVTAQPKSTMPHNPIKITATKTIDKFDSALPAENFTLEISRPSGAFSITGSTGAMSTANGTFDLDSASASTDWSGALVYGDYVIKETGGSNYSLKDIVVKVDGVVTGNYDAATKTYKFTVNDSVAGRTQITIDVTNEPATLGGNFEFAAVKKIVSAPAAWVNSTTGSDYALDVASEDFKVNVKRPDGTVVGTITIDSKTGAVKGNTLPTSNWTAGKYLVSEDLASGTNFEKVDYVGQTSNVKVTVNGGTATYGEFILAGAGASTNIQIEVVNDYRKTTTTGSTATVSKEFSGTGSIAGMDNEKFELVLTNQADATDVVKVSVAKVDGKVKVAGLRYGATYVVTENLTATQQTYYTFVSGGSLKVSDTAAHVTVKNSVNSAANISVTAKKEISGTNVGGGFTVQVTGPSSFSSSGTATVANGASSANFGTLPTSLKNLNAGTYTIKETTITGGGSIGAFFDAKDAEYKITVTDSVAGPVVTTGKGSATFVVKATTTGIDIVVTNKPTTTKIIDDSKITAEKVIDLKGLADEAFDLTITDPTGKVVTGTRASGLGSPSPFTLNLTNWKTGGNIILTSGMYKVEEIIGTGSNFKEKEIEVTVVSGNNAATHTYVGGTFPVNSETTAISIKVTNETKTMANETTVAAALNISRYDGGLNPEQFSIEIQGPNNTTVVIDGDTAMSRALARDYDLNGSAGGTLWTGKLGYGVYTIAEPAAGVNFETSSITVTSGGGANIAYKDGNVYKFQVTAANSGPFVITVNKDPKKVPGLNNSTVTAKKFIDESDMYGNFELTLSGPNGFTEVANANLTSSYNGNFVFAANALDKLEVGTYTFVETADSSWTPAYTVQVNSGATINGNTFVVTSSTTKVEMQVTNKPKTGNFNSDNFKAEKTIQLNGLDDEDFKLVVEGTGNNETRLNGTRLAGDPEFTFPVLSGGVQLPYGTYNVKETMVASPSNFECKSITITVTNKGVTTVTTDSFTITPDTTNVLIEVVNIPKTTPANAKIKIKANKTLTAFDGNLDAAEFFLTIHNPTDVGGELILNASTGSMTGTSGVFEMGSGTPVWEGALQYGKYEITETAATDYVLKTMTGTAVTYENGKYYLTIDHSFNGGETITIDVVNEPKGSQLTDTAVISTKVITTDSDRGGEFMLEISGTSGFRATSDPLNAALYGGTFVFPAGTFQNLRAGTYRVEEGIGDLNYWDTPKYSIVVYNGGVAQPATTDGFFTVTAATTKVEITVTNSPQTVQLDKDTGLTATKVIDGNGLGNEQFTLAITSKAVNGSTPVVNIPGTVTGPGQFTLNTAAYVNGGKLQLPVGHYNVAETLITNSNFFMDEIEVTVTDTNGPKVTTDGTFEITDTTTKIAIKVTNKPKTSDGNIKINGKAVVNGYDAALTAEDFTLRIKNVNGAPTDLSTGTTSGLTPRIDPTIADGSFGTLWDNKLPYGKYELVVDAAKNYELDSITAIKGVSKDAGGKYWLTVDASLNLNVLDITVTMKAKTVDMSGGKLIINKKIIDSERFGFFTVTVTGPNKFSETAQVEIKKGSSAGVFTFDNPNALKSMQVGQYTIKETAAFGQNASNDSWNLSAWDATYVSSDTFVLESDTTKVERTVENRPAKSGIDFADFTAEKVVDEDGLPSEEFTVQLKNAANTVEINGKVTGNGFFVWDPADLAKYTVNGKLALPAGTYTVRETSSNANFERYRIWATVDGFHFEDLEPSGQESFSATFPVTEDTKTINITVTNYVKSVTIKDGDFTAVKVVDLQGLADEDFTIEIEGRHALLYGKREANAADNKFDFGLGGDLPLYAGTYVVKEDPATNFQLKDMSVKITNTDGTTATGTFNAATGELSFLVTAKTKKIEITVENEVKGLSGGNYKFDVKKDVTAWDLGIPAEAFELTIKAPNGSTFATGKTANAKIVPGTPASFTIADKTTIAFGKYEIVESAAKNFELVSITGPNVVAENGKYYLVIDSTFTGNSIDILVTNKPKTTAVGGDVKIDAITDVTGYDASIHEEFTLNIAGPGTVPPALTISGSTDGFTVVSGTHQGVYDLNGAVAGTQWMGAMTYGDYYITQNAVTNFDLDDVIVTMGSNPANLVQKNGNDYYFTVMNGQEGPFKITVKNKVKSTAGEITVNATHDITKYDAGLAAESFHLDFMAGASLITDGSTGAMSGSKLTDKYDLDSATSATAWSGKLNAGTYRVVTTLNAASNFNVTNISVKNNATGAELGTYNDGNKTYTFKITSSFTGSIDIVVTGEPKKVDLSGSGKVTATKKVVDSELAGSFDLTVTDPNGASITGTAASVDSSATKDFTFASADFNTFFKNLEVGTYTIAETHDGNWAPSYEVKVVNGGATVTSTNTFVVTAQTSKITITVTNKPVNKEFGESNFKASKTMTALNGLTDETFTLLVEGTGANAATKLNGTRTAGGTSFTFAEFAGGATKQLPVGKYTVKESAGTNFELRDMVITVTNGGSTTSGMHEGGGVYSFNITPQTTAVNIAVTNKPKTNASGAVEMTATKSVTDYDVNVPEGFGLKVTGPNNFSITGATANPMPTPSGNFTLSQSSFAAGTLEYGVYTISEDATTNYELDSITVTSNGGADIAKKSGSNYTFEVKDGQVGPFVITVTNKAKTLDLTAPGAVTAKKVIKDSELRDDFTLAITAPDNTVLSGNTGMMTSVNGTFGFTKANFDAFFKNAQVGKYTIAETGLNTSVWATPGYSVVVTDKQGGKVTTTDGTFILTANSAKVEITVTNTPVKASLDKDTGLVAEKVVDDSGLTPEVFTLAITSTATVNGTATPVVSIPGTVTGSGNFVLTTAPYINGSKLELPVGEYNVKETLKTGSNFQLDNIQVVVTSGGTAVTTTTGKFEVKHNTTSIKITVTNKAGTTTGNVRITASKTLNGYDAGLPKESFTLRIMKPDGTTELLNANTGNMTSNFGTFGAGNLWDAPLAFGRYTILEDAATNYELVGISVNGGAPTTYFDITAANQGPIAIVVTNKAKVNTNLDTTSVTAQKVVTAGEDDTFGITVTGPSGFTAATASVTTNPGNRTGAPFTFSGVNPFASMPVGTYTVAETAAAGWTPSYSVTVTSGGAQVTTTDGKFVILANTTKVEITVTNAPVEKTFTKDTFKATKSIRLNGLADEAFTLKVEGTAGNSFNLTGNRAAGAGDFTFATSWPLSVPVGSYKVTETMNAGTSSNFELDNIKITVTNGSTPVVTTDGTFVITPATTKVEMAVTNKPKTLSSTNDLIDADKQVNGYDASLPGESFKLNILKADGTVLTTGTTATITSAGTVSFNLPSSTTLEYGVYTIQEVLASGSSYVLDGITVNGLPATTFTIDHNNQNPVKIVVTNKIVEIGNGEDGVKVNMTKVIDGSKNGVTYVAKEDFTVVFEHVGSGDRITATIDSTTGAVTSWTPALAAQKWRVGKYTVVETLKAGSNFDKANYAGQSSNVKITAGGKTTYGEFTITAAMKPASGPIPVTVEVNNKTRKTTETDSPVTAVLEVDHILATFPMDPSTKLTVRFEGISRPSDVVTVTFNGSDFTKTGTVYKASKKVAGLTYGASYRVINPVEKPYENVSVNVSPVTPGMSATELRVEASNPQTATVKKKLEMLGNATLRVGVGRCSTPGNPYMVYPPITVTVNRPYQSALSGNTANIPMGSAFVPAKFSGVEKINSLIVGEYTFKTFPDSLPYTSIQYSYSTNNGKTWTKMSGTSLVLDSSFKDKDIMVKAYYLFEPFKIPNPGSSGSKSSSGVRGSTTTTPGGGGTQPAAMPQAPVGSFQILADEVPLGNLPKTGSNKAVKGGGALGFLALIAGLLRKKKDSADAGEDAGQ